jgi:hypothetical protein
MSLLEQQLIIGQCLRATAADVVAALMADPPQQIDLDREQLIALADLVQSPGFNFTKRVQRSWCLGRTEAAAQLTLSVVSAEQRRQLVESWVHGGGGTAFDPTSEADAFLEYVGSRLANPSHALTICQMEQAVYRASTAALRFAARDPSLLNDPQAALGRGEGAALVKFFADPERLLAAVATQQPLPPLADECFPILFAPGLPALWQAAGEEEASLWERLSVPTSMQALTLEGYPRHVIALLFSIAAIDLSPPDDNQSG